MLNDNLNLTTLVRRQRAKHSYGLLALEGILLQVGYPLDSGDPKM